MNKVILVAISAIAFASAAAYAQMDHGQQHGSPDMMQQMHEKMQKMHGKQGRQGAGHEHGSQTGSKQDGAAPRKLQAGTPRTVLMVRGATGVHPAPRFTPSISRCMKG